jgi:hypothetical protein
MSAHQVGVVTMAAATCSVLERRRTSGSAVSQTVLAVHALSSALSNRLYHERKTRNDKSLPKKAFVFNMLFWLPDLDSNQGPAD